MNVSWDFFSRRRKIDLRDFVSKFSSYEEICKWCEAKGVEPPEESSVKVILNPPKPKPKSRATRKPRIAKPKSVPAKAVTKTKSKSVPQVSKTEVVKAPEEKESDA